MTSKAEPPSDELVDKDRPLYIGHRDRLRDRFVQSGADALQDYELLELVLFPILPRRDTKVVAKKMIERFGSFSGALTAPARRLQEIEGLGEVATTQIAAIVAVAQRFARTKITDGQPILGSWTALLDYCHSQLAFETIEHFRVLFLDKKNRLIKDELQQTGTVDHTPVYPREVIKRALELSATALILVHNHPSGDPAPSPADVQMTKQVNDIAKPLGITLHDHIIIGKSGHASLRALKLM